MLDKNIHNQPQRDAMAMDIKETAFVNIAVAKPYNHYDSASFNPEIDKMRGHNLVVCSGASAATTASTCSQ